MSDPWSGELPGEQKIAKAHSSILARKSPWTDNTGGIQSMESQSVGQYLMTKTIATIDTRNQNPS